MTKAINDAVKESAKVNLSEDEEYKMLSNTMDIKSISDSKGGTMSLINPINRKFTAVAKAFNEITTFYT